PPKPGPPPEVATALSSIVEPTHGGHAARFWTGTDLTPEGKSRLMFVWEPLPLQEGARGRDIPARVMLTATAADGHPVFRGPVGSVPPGGADAAATSAATTGGAAGAA